MLKISKVKLNPVIISKEQMQTVKKNVFNSECEKFFKQVDRFSLNSNTYFWGKFLNNFERDGINEAQLVSILRGVRKLTEGKPNIKNINLVNVIYSSLIKQITTEDIISGVVKPETYRNIINDSIRMYKDYPLRKSVDYRHILGRMVSLKNMNGEIRKKFNDKLVPQKYNALWWTQDEQLEFVNTLERIILQYKKSNSSFVHKQSKIADKHNEEFTLENTTKNYHKNLVVLLQMIFHNTSKLMKDLKTNAYEISYNKDLAFYYINKIPFDFLIKSESVKRIQSEFIKIGEKLNKLSCKKS